MADTKPWERQRDRNGELESNLWFHRRTEYRLMPKPRSLLECVNRARDEKGQNRSNYVPGAWRRAFKEWQWKEAAEAWDEHLRQEDEAEWEDRRKQIKEREWEGAEKLLERVEKMLGYPLAEVIQEDKEGRIFKVQPVRWRQSDVTRFMEMASKLARLAAGMETERQQVDVTSKGEQISGFAVLSDAELAAEIAELDARIAEIEGAEGGDAPRATDPGSSDEP